MLTLVKKADLTDLWKVPQKGTFRDSVTWKGNEQAYYTVREFCGCWEEAPGVTVIYGELGCGKYHLMQSMFKELLSTDQVLTIATLSGYGIHEGLSLEDFEVADVLFLHNFCRAWENKELRNTTMRLLKYFVNAGKKVVLSGTYSLAAWYDLEKYMPGLLVDACFLEIKNPDKEECMDIIRYWIKKEGYEKYGIDEEMIDLIANVGTTNVRILEGTFIKVIAMARLEKQTTITIPFLKQIFEV